MANGWSVRDEDWRRYAACRGMDPNIFYPTQRQPVSPDAVATCESCPVREPCLDHALRHEDMGFWGGTSARTREQIRKALRIPSPPRDALPAPLRGKNGYDASYGNPGAYAAKPT